MRLASRRRGCGFTLVELLVVVSIIALLISILLPSLKKARQRAREAACLANCKSLGSAGITYASDDRNENAIPVHRRLGEFTFTVGAYEWGGKAGAGHEAGDDLTDPLDSTWGTKKGRGPGTRGLNNVIYKGGIADNTTNPGDDQINWKSDSELKLDVYRCPGDLGYTGRHYITWRDQKLTSYDHYGTSYVCNTAWVGVFDADCLLHSNAAFLRPISRIPNPAATLMFMENCGRNGPTWNYGNGCNGTQPDDVIGGWHGRDFRFNVTFADAHAENTLMQGHYIPQPELSTYPPTLTNAGGGYYQGSYFFYRCVIIRGPGWQWDTLPAPPVRSEMSCYGRDYVPTD